MRAQAAVQTHPHAVVRLGVDAKAEFITRTYAHLFGAMAGFTLIEIALFATGTADKIAGAVAGNWLIFIGGFMLVGWLARSVALKAQSAATQYAALVGFVAMEAVLFVPLLWMANNFAPGTITSAAVVSLGGFAGLTMIAFITRKDFSFLRGVLMFAGLIAIVLIFTSPFTGFSGGLFFSGMMVLVAGGSILYDTSNILHHYPPDKHVSASLELFASVALLFWYVLQIFMSRD